MIAISNQQRDEAVRLLEALGSIKIVGRTTRVADQQRRAKLLAKKLKNRKPSLLER